MMERGKPVSGRCAHLYPITVGLLEEERRLAFLSMDNEVCLAWVWTRCYSYARKDGQRLWATWKQFWKRSFSKGR